MSGVSSIILHIHNNLGQGEGQSDNGGHCVALWAESVVSTLSAMGATRGLRVEANVN